MRLSLTRNFLALVTMLACASYAQAQSDVWTKDHEAVSNLLQQYADDMQANRFEEADTDLRYALARVKRMQRSGRDVTASNPVGINLYEAAQNAEELTKNKVDDTLRSDLHKLMDALI